ncbi:MAG: hypothetical protein WDO72_12790 [Pseudomonadota bacterium]
MSKLALRGRPRRRSMNAALLRAPTRRAPAGLRVEILRQLASQEPAA